MSIPSESDPAGVSSADVEAAVRDLLGSAVAESTDMALERLLELGDMQWHTYEAPSQALRLLLEQWLSPLVQSADQKGLEDVLAVAYCFSLDAVLFGRALSFYSGEHRREFEVDLARSHDGFIDPWWSLRK